MRAVVLVASAWIATGCEPPAPEAPVAQPAWVTPPPPSAWPLGPARGSIGRTLAPQVVLQSGVTHEDLKLVPSLRLERVTPRSAIIYEPNGVRAYVAFAMDSAVVHEDAIVGFRGDHSRRFPLPAHWQGELSVSKPLPVSATAELRDLPAIEAVDGTSVALDGATQVARSVLIADALVVETPAGLARFDLRRRTWGMSQPRCNATGALVLCRDGDRAAITGAETGKVLATIASDDGGDVIAAVLDVTPRSTPPPDDSAVDMPSRDDLGGSGGARPGAGMAMVVAAERGRVVARLPYVEMVPAWSLEVHGVVSSIDAADDAVLVTLEDGDAYRIDARTGVPTALAGSGAGWRVIGDMFAGTTHGGPIPPREPLPPPPPPEPRAAPLGDQDTPPRLMTTVPAPPMEASTQLALYDHTGALHARNDYALTTPVEVGLRSQVGGVVLANQSELLVVEPVHGDPVRRIRLPSGAIPATAFATVIDGKPLVGVLAVNPVRVVLF